MGVGGPDRLVLENNGLKSETSLKCMHGVHVVIAFLLAAMRIFNKYVPVM